MIDNWLARPIVESTEKCDTCKGEGKVDGVECGDCDGTGEIWVRN